MKLTIIGLVILLTGCAENKAFQSVADGKNGSSCSASAVAGGTLVKCSDGSENFIANGVNGTNGSSGLKGDKGNDGINGINGTNGSNGIVGQNGSNGANGVNGTNGKDGTQLVLTSGTPVNTLGVDNDLYIDKNNYNLYKKVSGAYVFQGTLKGADGLSFHSSNTNPVNSFGYNGELFYNITSYDVFKKVNGVWTLVSNLKGVKGDTGAQGLQGVQGVAGLMGLTGATGAQGLQGTQGASGQAGAQGNQGQQGNTGVSGAVGPMGPQGPKGNDGTCVNTPNLKIYSNIPQGTCHQLPGTSFYVYHSGTHIWFKRYSSCSHANDGVICERVSQYTVDGASSHCWIGNKQYTVMGTGSNLKVYETTHLTNN
jgi:Collagen triple helix repeat (20 copies)